MNVRKLYVEHILPALQSFKAGYRQRDIGHGRDIARGADIADMLLNLPEYLFGEAPRSPYLAAYRTAREYREQHCWRASRDYEIACDLANAWKHRTISRTGRTLDGVEAVKEAYVLCRYKDDEGYYYRGHKVVVLSMTNGLEADLRRVLVSATRFWGDELERMQVVPATSSEHFDYDEFVSRSDPEALPPLQCHFVEGEKVDLPSRTLDYDPTVRRWVDVPRNSGFDGVVPLTIVIRSSPFEASHA